MHKLVMARSFWQLSPTLLHPLRGCERLHNLEAARCFQGSSLIKNVTDWISGGVLSKGGNARCSTWDNGKWGGPKLWQPFLWNFWWRQYHVWLTAHIQHRTQDEEQRRNSANYRNDKTSCEDLTLIYFVCKYLDRLNMEAKIPKSVCPSTFVHHRIKVQRV